jgi:hypothetical protein
MGAIAETAITYHATELGIVVLKPMIKGCRYDLVLDTGDRLLRTQCKWARRKRDIVVVRIRTCRHTPDGYVRGTYSAAEIEGVAAWCPDTRECYFVPIADIDGQGFLHLRLAPARNNQELFVHWASQYRLGAIAQMGERLTGSQKVVGSSPTSSTLEGPLS